jgi:hypothetical protein
LVVYSAACIFFAVILAVAAQSSSPLLDRALLSPFFDVQALPSNLPAYNAFNLRVLAGTMAGWSVCMLGLALGPFARREPWARRTMAAALVSWFCIDTAGSAVAGVWFNVVGNGIFLLAGGLPLIATRKHFERT